MLILEAILDLLLFSNIHYQCLQKLHNCVHLFFYSFMLSHLFETEADIKKKNESFSFISIFLFFLSHTRFFSIRYEPSLYLDGFFKNFFLDNESLILKNVYGEMTFFFTFRESFCRTFFRG